MAKRNEPFTLTTQRWGPLPIVNHVIRRLDLARILEELLPPVDKRAKLPYAKPLGVLLRSIVVEREPIYRQQDAVRSFAPCAFGLAESEVDAISDDAIGRALDRLFSADRGSLLTAVVRKATQEFHVELDELHNDSTSVRFFGQYRGAKGQSIRGQKAPWVSFGYSKDHRPDLKQLLYILTTSADGGVPLHFRCADGNTSDVTTHVETWEALVEFTGRKDFLYVADSKLCSYDNMEPIHERGGRFVTVLPRSRREDAQFREWIQKHDPPWEKVWDRPNPRRKRGPRDVWWVYREVIPSREAWPIIWVYSSLLRLQQHQSRQERLTRARQDLDRLKESLAGKRPRLKSPQQIEERVQRILRRYRVRDYIRAWVYPEERVKFRQERPGRPTPDMRYRKEVNYRLALAYEVDQTAIDYDEKSDGMYPLMTNDRSLTPAEVLAAHKRQPQVEKRFKNLKSVHQIAPVFLKNPGRIEALFFLYFLALMVEALIEREIRLAMKRQGVSSLPLYPEGRPSKRPTTHRILELFSHVEGHILRDTDDQVVQVFQPEFTTLQAQVLELLGVSEKEFAVRPAGV